MRKKKCELIVWSCLDYYVVFYSVGMINCCLDKWNGNYYYVSGSVFYIDFEGLRFCLLECC